MHNIFTFQPVGQGLFYTAQLDDGNFNFVYDCGTDYKTGGCKKRLEEAIDRFSEQIIYKSKKINFLVVSHLDSDHIVGIYKLQKKKVQINKIYLPYYNKDLVELTLQLALSASGELEELENIRLYWFGLYGIVEYNEEIFGKKPEVIFCGEENDDEVKSYESEYIIKRKQLAEKINWEFVMFNKQISNSKVKSLQYAIDSFLKTNNYKNISDIKFNQKNTIYLQGIYDKELGRKNRNASSTILVHYPKADSCHFFACSGNYQRHKIFMNGICDCCRYVEPLYHPANIITCLTGDAEFDTTMLQGLEKLIDFNKKKTVKIFQIPHHGSKKNWDLVSRLKYCFDYYIFPFGYGNIHRHPSYLIIEDLLINMKEIRFATQFEFFSYEIEIL